MPLVALLAALSVAAVGCGAQERPNDLRPPVPTRISVKIDNDAVTVDPALIGVGPDRRDQIPQNAKVRHPDIPNGGPLVVTFVTANLTTTSTRLKLRGPTNATSGPMVANGNGTFQVPLPAGRYTISANGLRIKPAVLRVGSFRGSSANDVLLP